MLPDQAPGTLAKTPESRYANYFEIGFNAHEIIIDFGQFHTGDNAPRIYSRIVTSPAYALYLLELLQKTLSDHQIRFHSSGRD